MKSKIYFLFAMLLSIATSAMAADYYVATTGDDTAGNGSSSLPFLTVEKAVATATSGDVIHVGEGTFTTTGNFNKSVTWQGAGAGLTIIQGNAEPASSTINPNKRFYNYANGTGNLIIKDLTLQNFGFWNSDNGGGTFNLNGTATINLTMLRCNLLNGTARQSGGIQFLSGGTITLEDCYFGGNVAKPNCITSKEANKGNYGMAVLSIGSTGSAIIKNCIFHNNNLNDGTSLTSWSVDGTSASPIAINIANTVTSVIFVNNTFLNNGVIDKNPLRDGATPSVTTGPVILANCNATTFVVPITKYINNININEGYTDFAVTSTTTAINTGGLLKNNIFRVANYISAWEADNIISSSFTNASTEIGIVGGSTPNVTENATGVKIITAYGTQVIGMGLADADVKATDINGFTRTTSFALGAVESLATKIVTTKATPRILVQNRVLRISNVQNTKVDIYALSGACIYSQKAEAQHNITITQPGLYFIKVSDVQGSSTQKILVR